MFPLRLLKRDVCASDRILIVSAAAGFEIVQKALMPQVPVLGSAGAASSLVVARERMALYSSLGNGRGYRYI